MHLMKVSEYANQYLRCQAGKKKPKARLKDIGATSYSEEDDSDGESVCGGGGGGGGEGARRHATSCLMIPLLTVDSSRGGHADAASGGSAKTRKGSRSPPVDGVGGGNSPRSSISRQVLRVSCMEHYQETK